MVPRRVSPGNEEDMQARYEQALNDNDSDEGNVGEPEMVPNGNFYNPPQYTQWEWIRMIMSPRPGLPPTYTRTFQFFNPYDEDLHAENWRSIYPLTPESSFMRWFPRLYYEPDSSNDSFEDHCWSQDRLMAEYSQHLQREFNMNSPEPSAGLTPSGSSSQRGITSWTGVVEAIKDLVQDCNFDCNDDGIQLQAMDNSHVALVSMKLSTGAFSPFRCDRNIALGINLNSLMKVLRAAGNDDILTLKAEDQPDSLNLVFESPGQDRMSEYDIKLMDIDQEHLGIPETEYAATISLPSAEFQRICRDLSALSESVSIEASKDGVKFSCSGDIGNGSVTLRPHTNVEDESKSTSIALTEPVNLTFSLKYLVNFCKASSLSGSVQLCLSNEVPLLVEFKMGAGYLRFYLAPKIGDEE
ncbi:hypothetical protein H072_3051 [Dactylellina haptotyla CBS 200.50]|uniref:DNA sliding clamp PCNA n=1 Tax=Dactylellina haptotyla (strain CBS 200.50) TaxID=1284197 RepID=S8AIV8_DACHA|nr:hypothetical protein H072_3051 [Dactylellina haptotyla CBS 200.50]